MRGLGGGKFRGRLEDAMATCCKHLKEIRKVQPSGNGCKECLELGDTWVHLRLCLICGHVGCCDDSKNKHATKNFHSTKHPTIQSFNPAQHWKSGSVTELPLEKRCL